MFFLVPYVDSVDKKNFTDKDSILGNGQTDDHRTSTWKPGMGHAGDLLLCPDKDHSP